MCKDNGVHHREIITILNIFLSNCVDVHTFGTLLDGLSLLKKGLSREINTLLLLLLVAHHAHHYMFYHEKP